MKEFYKPVNVNIGEIISSGKDGLYASYVMEKQNYDISCVITIQSENKDSFMFHTPNVELVKLQEKAMGRPLVIQKTKGKKEAR